MRIKALKFSITQVLESVLEQQKGHAIFSVTFYYLKDKNIDWTEIRIWICHFCDRKSLKSEYIRKICLVILNSLTFRNNLFCFPYKFSFWFLMKVFIGWEYESYHEPTLLRIPFQIKSPIKSKWFSSIIHLSLLRTRS